MCFSLGSSVGDISWSPFSATVLAAVTEDGFIRVFDLHKDAAEPLCEQRVVTKAALTRVAFNPLYPLLLAGDDRYSYCLKGRCCHIFRSALLSGSQAASTFAISN